MDGGLCMNPPLVNRARHRVRKKRPRAHRIVLSCANSCAPMFGRKWVNSSRVAGQSKCNCVQVKCNVVY